MVSRAALRRSIAVGGAVLAVLGGGVAVPQAHQTTSTGDRPVTAGDASAVLLGGEWGDDQTHEDEQASAATGSWRADQDQGSMYWVTKQYGAQQVWTEDDPDGRTVTGKGVTVALIDTGVSPVAGLDAPGKVINGPDLSFDGQVEETRYLDGYGHGTHMAAIIAGRDASVVAGDENDPTKFVGIAPDARILNVKVGAADGGTDVTQVIAALDWVVQHRYDQGMDVRVINLSYGTASVQPYQLDPLAHAVQNAWRQGIVVVVAAGNDGIDTPSLTMPALDPYVIAVGAVDHRGTPTQDDDAVAAFTNGGSVTRRPDLLAPGKSVVSLRVPGSTADREHPEGMVAGDPEGRFFRGSGTSQAAAIVSGAVALLLQDRPELTPDGVKFLLQRTAAPLEENRHRAMGSGVLDIERAIGSKERPYNAVQAWPASTGLGSLEASRGGANVVDPVNGALLSGETDAMGSPWDARSWSTASAAGEAWTGGVWNGRSWSGDGWSARSWSGDSWAARSWSGTSWSGLDWLARSWSGEQWVARSWSGDEWRARSWSGTS